MQNQYGRNEEKGMTTVPVPPAISVCGLLERLTAELNETVTSLEARLGKYVTREPMQRAEPAVTEAADGTSEYVAILVETAHRLGAQVDRIRNLLRILEL